MLMVKQFQHVQMVWAAGLAALLLCLAAPAITDGAFLYKSYVVRKDGAKDILCDPYIVQPNDYVLKIFRQKGEISQANFDDFLRIFQRINPHIPDINIIRPGQQIYIPLKRLTPNSLPGQATGVVTIPFVTISSLPELLDSYAAEYKVRKGDTVSILVARKYGGYGTASYRQGIELFKQLNPKIVDLNRINKGQVVRLPDPSIRNEPWYDALFDPAGNFKPEGRPQAQPPSEMTAAVALPEETAEKTVEETTPAAPEELGEGSAFAQAARILGAELHDSGVYYFPGTDRQDVAIDLAEYPLMKLADESRIIFARDNLITPADQSLIRSFWGKTHFAAVSAGASLEQILDSASAAMSENSASNRLSFSDNGIDIKVRARWITEKTSPDGFTESIQCITMIEDESERTSEPLRRYLEENDILIRDILRHRRAEGSPAKAAYKIPDKEVLQLPAAEPGTWIRELARSLGYAYEKNIPLSFSYGDLQLTAETDVIRKPDGTKLLVDYANLQGDALEAIRESGLSIIQVPTPIRSPDQTLQHLLEALNLRYFSNPTFFAANRPDIYNTSVTIPGFLISPPGKPQKLLTRVPLHFEIVQFLIEDGIQILVIQ